MRTKNAMQLKAIIRNKAKEQGVPPQLVMQNYLLERLLERVSLSSWRDNVVIKGGMLISSLVGVGKRSTKDLDTTVRGFPLTHDERAREDELPRLWRVRLRQWGCTRAISRFNSRTREGCDTVRNHPRRAQLFVSIPAPMQGATATCCMRRNALPTCCIQCSTSAPSRAEKREKSGEKPREPPP